MKKNRENILEEIYQLDPLIKKAAEKLKKLSEDGEVVSEYKNREEELTKEIEEQIIKELKSLKFEEWVYNEPNEYQLKLRELYNFCKEKGIPISSLSRENIMQFVERKNN